MSSPRDIKMDLPDGGRLPRVGKLRLGVKVERMKDGKAISFPSAKDYFVVNEDASTNRQSAESFHQVYGDEPRELDIVLPATRAEDVLEGAWRQYGTGGKMKRKCTGPGGNCVTRADDGEWEGPMPCACEAAGLSPDDKRNHCQLRYTLTVMLMRVAGVGVWQLDTGSVMAGEGLTASLRLLEQFRGHLQGAKATLRVVPRQVAPEGKAKTVWIVELGSLDITPQQALEIAQERSTRVALPASSLDEEPDPLLDGQAHELVAGEVVDGSEYPFPYEPVTMPSVPTGGLRKALAALNAHQKQTLFEACGLDAETPTPLKDIRAALVDKWSELKLDPFDGEPVPVTLLGAIYEAQPRDPNGAEAFQHFADTGESIDPGDQAVLA